MWMAAAFLGVLGSAHCVAMCGPLVVACSRPGPLRGRLSTAVVYHAGRLATYALLGAGSAALVAFFDIGRSISVLAGVALVAVGLVPAIARRAPRWMAFAFTLAAPIAAAARRLDDGWPLTSRFVAGVANGLLPCGMVYAALGFAAASGSPGGAALTMTAFGAGTVPALMLTSLAVTGLPECWRGRWRRAAPLGAAILGGLLLARGLATPQPAPIPHGGAGNHLRNAIHAYHQ